MKKTNRKNDSIVSTHVESIQISQGVRYGLYILCIVAALITFLLTYGVETTSDVYEFVRKVIGTSIFMVWVVAIISLSRAIRIHKLCDENTTDFATPVSVDGVEFISKELEDEETISIRAKKNLRAIIVFLLGLFYSIFILSVLISGVSDTFIYGYFVYSVYLIIFSTFVIEPGIRTNIKAFLHLKLALFILILPSILTKIFDLSFLHVHYYLWGEVETFLIVIGSGALFLIAIFSFVRIVNRFSRLISYRHKLKTKRKAQNPYGEYNVNMGVAHEGFEDEEGQSEVRHSH